MVDFLSPSLLLPGSSFSLEDWLSVCLPTIPHETRQALSHQWDRERLEKFAKEKCILVEMKKNAIIGIGVFSSPEGGVGTLFWLLTQPAYQSQGVGQRILQGVEHHLREKGAHKVKLTAPTEIARDFYCRRGYNVEGFHPRHWYDWDFWSLGKSLRSIEERKHDSVP